MPLKSWKQNRDFTGVESIFLSSNITADFKYVDIGPMPNKITVLQVHNNK